jgi:hypothetical protein
MSDESDRQLRILRQRTRPPVGPPDVPAESPTPPPLPPNAPPEYGLAKIVKKVGNRLYTITQDFGGNPASALSGIVDQEALDICWGAEDLEPDDLVLFFWARNIDPTHMPLMASFALMFVGLHVTEGKRKAGMRIEYCVSGISGCSSLVFDKYGILEGVYDHSGRWVPRVWGVDPTPAGFVDGRP